jgi:hypothetical protein
MIKVIRQNWIEPGTRNLERKLNEGIEHQTTIKSASKPAHHKSVPEFSDHNDLNMGAS